MLLKQTSKVYVDGLIQDTYHSQRQGRHRKRQSLKGPIAIHQSNESLDQSAVHRNNPTRYQICSTLRSEGSKKIYFLPNNSGDKKAEKRLSTQDLKLEDCKRPSSKSNDKISSRNLATCTPYVNIANMINS